MNYMDNFDILSTMIEADLFNDLIKAGNLMDAKINTTAIGNMICESFFSVAPNKKMNAYDALECIVVKSLLDRDFHFQHSLYVGNFVADEISSYIDSLLYNEFSDIRFSKILQIARDVTSSLSIANSDTVVSIVEIWLTWLINISSSHNEAYMAAA